MTQISARLERLEAQRHPPEGNRVYTVIGGAEGDDPTAFVRAQGFVVNDAADLVVHIQGWEPSEDGVRYWGGSPMGWCGPLPPDKWRVAD